MNVDLRPLLAMSEQCKRQGKWWALEAETSLVMSVASPRVNEGQPGLPWGKGGHAKR